jgi:hypothetical protein
MLGLFIFVIGSAIGLPENVLQLVVLLVNVPSHPILIGWLGWWRDAGFVTTTQHVPALIVPLIVALFTLAWFGTVTLESGLVAWLAIDGQAVG